ncbi:assembly of actin patch protein, partial [Neodidymelliopsis sp. IMI 364377]
KPFVAPPPSRNAYVPPPKEAPQVKTYRRDEDPEIADRQAQDQDAAEKSGLSANTATNPNEAEEEGPKLSLKERIALLQKQQQEQAERAAAAMHKEKPKRPVQKKRLESHEGHAEDSEDTELEKVPTAGSATRASIDHARPPRPSHDIKSPESQHYDRDVLSDANDADQSGAGETEDQDGDSTSVEGDEKRTALQPPLPLRAPAAPAREPDVGDEQDVANEDEQDEEEEEDEMDAETRRKLELRERMAKMSGGMGMPGMFGGIPMGGLPPKKKKSTGDKKADESEEPHVPQQRVAMFPMPGMPSVRSPEQENRQLAVEKEDEPHHPVTGSHPADEVTDVEDVTPHALSRTPTAESAPPVPQDGKLYIPRKPVNACVRPLLDHFQLSSSEVVSKTYTAFDGISEYVMTVSVSSMSRVVEENPPTTGC